ncbi:hypothetical protein BX589_10166 [Paraburkholderia fungorum]|jgi:hypothetical protein|uniref:hypothetical protein n=1 Tax=Paraburkholderia fungorum TaxID=134537 RepID=UPI000D071958|nr:hypothetical protein [Paraburkholderia fungorum]PRZ56416.1 hypothetical protein BX589_10166 [Paraburkholderia fungorum]
MAVFNDFPFFEIDAPARASLPFLDKAFPTQNAGFRDYSDAVDKQWVDGLRTRWNTWPTIGDLLAALDTRLRVTTPSGGVEEGALMALDPGPPQRFRFASRPPPTGRSSWIYQGGWRRQSSAFLHAAAINLISGDWPVTVGKKDEPGEAAERFAWEAAKELLAPAHWDGMPWTHRGEPMPPMVRPVAFNVQLLAPIPKDEVGGELGPKGLPDAIRAIDQVWVFQANAVIYPTAAKPGENPDQPISTPDHAGELFAVAVEIDGDGDGKWTRIVSAESRHSGLEKQRARSKRLMAAGFEIFRMAATDCSSKEKAKRWLEELIWAISARLYIEGQNRPRSQRLTYADDLTSVAYLDRAIDERKRASLPAAKNVFGQVVDARRIFRAPPKITSLSQQKLLPPPASNQQTLPFAQYPRAARSASIHAQAGLLRRRAHSRKAKP